LFDFSSGSEIFLRKNRKKASGDWLSAQFQANLNEQFWRENFVFEKQAKKKKAEFW